MNIELIKGDITKVESDAIMNAANTSLFGGGGVDGAIHRAGGKEILEECVKIRNKQGGFKAGEVVFTNAGKLNAKIVIHTVGPRWNKAQSKEKSLLSNCNNNSLRIAEDLELTSIAFPNISTGIYKYPKPEASNIAIEQIKSHKSISAKRILFFCYDEDNYNIYKEILK